LTTPLAWSRDVDVAGEIVTQTVGVQGNLDAILPFMLPVLVTWLSYYLLQKGWTPIRVILVLIVIGFVGGAFGILG
jgi:PTS system mannose-specific IID component